MKIIDQLGLGDKWVLFCIKGLICGKSAFLFHQFTPLAAILLSVC